MSSDWDEKSLSELVTIKHGFAFKGEDFSNSPTPFVLTTPGNFAIGGGFQVGKKKFYSGTVPANYKLKPGDLLVTMTDLSKQADTLGYPAWLPVGLSENYLHNQRVGFVELKAESIASKRWIYYLMCTAEYRNWIVNSATGSTVKHTSPLRIGEFVARIPPPSIQEKIVRILDPIENSITLLATENAALESIAQTLFRSWFVDFDPVHAKVAGNVPGAMSAELAALFPSEFENSELGLIPKGWAFESLDNRIDYLNGLALQKFPPIEGEATLPIIKIAQLKAGRGDQSILANRRMKPAFIVKDGDIIFSWSGSLALRIWTGGEGALNQHLFKVSSTKLPHWFCFQATLLHLVSFQATAASKATTMGHIQRHHLTEAKVAVPPDKLIKKMSAVFSPLQDSIVMNGQLMRALAGLRDHILPRLISGKLRLEDAEASVEAITSGLEAEPV